MKQDMGDFWKQSAEQMQQSLMGQWAGALQALQNLAPAVAGTGTAAEKLPAISLSQPMLQQLRELNLRVLPKEA